MCGQVSQCPSPLPVQVRLHILQPQQKELMRSLGPMLADIITSSKKAAAPSVVSWLYSVVL